jgi:drug/metabolite transporter (DMT)-like permease
MNTQYYKGVSYIAISALFYASYGVWAHLMIGSFDVFSQAWVRGAMGVVILGILGTFLGQFKKVKRSDWGWFVFITCMGGLNQAPYFWGFKHLSIGTATLLFYTALVVGAYGIGWICFHETLTKPKLVALAMSLIGLSLIYSFSLSSEQMFPAASTITAGLMGASFVVFSKKLSGTYSEIQILASTFVVMMVVNVSADIFIGPSLLVVNTIVPWLAQVGYILSMILANVAVIAGFKYIDPSVGGLIGLLEVVLASLLGIVLFGEVLAISTGVGGMLILMAIAIPDIVRLIQKRSIID